MRLILWITAAENYCNKWNKGSARLVIEMKPTTITFNIATQSQKVAMIKITCVSENSQCLIRKQIEMWDATEREWEKMRLRMGLKCQPNLILSCHCQWNEVEFFGRTAWVRLCENGILFEWRFGCCFKWVSIHLLFEKSPKWQLTNPRYLNVNHSLYSIAYCRFMWFNFIGKIQSQYTYTL